MNKIDKGPQRDDKYQISNLYTFQFQRKRILKMGFFIPMFQLVTHGLWPILTLGASSTRRCYIPNIKALVLKVWDKKIFKNFLLCEIREPTTEDLLPFLGHNLIILVEGHYMMLHAKYESSSPYGLEQDDF